ncbi:MAG: KamA family radical SAM protein, partial [Planctomycetota bacterium]|nr:KamA family radical SAM protein [Planctomycetota bacterium]
MRPASAKGDTLASQNAEASVPSSGAWRAELAAAIRDVAGLRRALDLPPDPAASRAEQSFPVLVPPAYLARIRRGDPHDPLLRQVLPIAAEMVAVPGYGPDPVSEQGCQAVPGLLRKYQGRALLVTTAACAVHCRYCFRRSFPYHAVPRGRAWWQPAAAAVAADPSLDELILSGGDPLTLPDATLAALVADVAAPRHIKRLRIHTRLPVMIPSRIDPSCLAWLMACGKEVVVVIHANHPNEIDAEVAAACRRLQGAGFLVFN